jgi:hypothetical protein
MKPREALRAAARYVRQNPGVVVKAASDATKLRFGIPVRVLLWAVSQSAKGGNGGQPKKNAPTDIEIGASPPALRFAASIDAMGTPLRVSAAIRVEDVFIAPDTVRVAIRLNEVQLALLGESDSPIAMLIKSGVLDLSKPGNVVKVLPKRPAFVVEAGGDRIVLDLLKVPALAKNARFRRLLSVLSPLVGVKAIETDGEHLYLELKATPRGLPDAWNAARARG